MRVFLVFLWAALLSSSAWATSDRQSCGPVLVLGDSLSAGFGIQTNQSWVALLEQRLAEEGYGYPVVNASISGDTTGGGLRRLPRALELHEPTVVVIELGGNDGLRGYPVAMVHENLEGMVQLSRASGARVLIAGMQIPPNYGTTYTRAFADIYGSVARDNDASLIAFLLDQVALNPDMMQADGIHPNAQAQPVILDNVWQVLQPEILDDIGPCGAALTADSGPAQD